MRMLTLMIDIFQCSYPHLQSKALDSMWMSGDIRGTSRSPHKHHRGLCNVINSVRCKVPSEAPMAALPCDAAILHTGLDDSTLLVVDSVCEAFSACVKQLFRSAQEPGRRSFELEGSL